MANFLDELAYLLEERRTQSQNVGQLLIDKTAAQRLLEVRERQIVNLTAQVSNLQQAIEALRLHREQNPGRSQVTVLTATGVSVVIDGEIAQELADLRVEGGGNRRALDARYSQEQSDGKVEGEAVGGSPDSGQSRGCAWGGDKLGIFKPIDYGEHADLGGPGRIDPVDPAGRT